MKKKKSKLLGNRIKNIRINLGETMEEFGERFNTSKGTINNWEKNRNIPNKENLKIIADIINITVDELLHGNNQLFLELTDDETILLNHFADKENLSIEEVVLQNTIYKNKETETTHKAVGQRIKEIRVNEKDTLESFSQKINKYSGGVIKSGKSNVSRWEKGENLPNDITLKAIADIGNITVNELLYGNSITLKELKNFLASIEGSKLADEIDNFTLEKLDIMVENWTTFYY